MNTPYGVGLISAERTRQQSVEGWSADHDNKHDAGEMAMAAALYATPVPIRAEMNAPCKYCDTKEECDHVFREREWRDPWPWDKEWDKRGKHGRVRQLAIAGALIAAEIDRLIRAGGAVPAPPADTSCPECRGTKQVIVANGQPNQMGPCPRCVWKLPPADTLATQFTSGTLRTNAVHSTVIPDSSRAVDSELIRSCLIEAKQIIIDELPVDPAENLHLTGHDAREIVTAINRALLCVVAPAVADTPAAQQLDTREREWRVAWHDAVGIMHCNPELSLLDAENTEIRLLLRSSMRYQAVRVQHSDDGGNTWVAADTPSAGEETK